MPDGIAMVKRLLGLPGMNVLEGDDGLVIKVETAETVGWCPGCGMRAQAQDRTSRCVRDLSCFGRAVRLDVWCRRWRCREVLCATKTWTENVEALDATAVCTRRAGAEACRQVGQQARPVAAVAREFGVCWWTVMNAVIEHGTPLVDDPDRVGTVTKLGVDETSFQAARPGLAARYVTGLVDLERRAMIDMAPGTGPLTCDVGVLALIRDGSPRSAWWPSIWPSRIALGCHRTSTTSPVSLTRSMWCASRTGAWTACAGGCRTNNSAIADANGTRCSRSARSSSPAPNASPTAVSTGCCSAYAPATRTTSSSAPGSQRNP